MWKRWRDEAHDPQSVAPSQSERRPDLREVVAREGGLEVAAARRAGSRYCQASGRFRKKRSRQHAGSERDRNHPPLHAHVDLELRDRSRHVSAGLLHHEVQPARERSRRASRGNRQRASVPAGEDFPGRAANHQDAERATDRNHRHGRDHAAARGRRARRDDRTADGSRLSPVARAMRARKF